MKHDQNVCISETKQSNSDLKVFQNINYHLLSALRFACIFKMLYSELKVTKAWAFCSPISVTYLPELTTQDFLFILSSPSSEILSETQKNSFHQYVGGVFQLPRLPSLCTCRWKYTKRFPQLYIVFRALLHFEKQCQFQLILTLLAKELF